MILKFRNPKETATIIAKAVKEIRDNKNINDKFISHVCNKYQLNESHIRKVGVLKTDEERIIKKELNK